MKLYIIFATLLFPATLLTQQQFKIVSTTAVTARLGYGDWNIALDGELRLMQQFLKPGAVVFDVGGNLGEWSSFALKTEPTIKLMTFEPVPDVCEKLKAALQPFSNVQVHNMALADKNGTSNFFYYCYPPQDCGLSGFYYREVLRGDHNEPVTITVSHTTLDDFCTHHRISTIDFLKIDTEGAEWSILCGAKDLLKHHHIKLIQFEYGGCYIDAKSTLKQVIEFLTYNGYLVFRIFPEGLIHIDRWDNSLENFTLSNWCALRAEDMPQYRLANLS